MIFNKYFFMFMLLSVLGLSLFSSAREFFSGNRQEIVLPATETMKAPKELNEGRRGPVLSPLKSRSFRRLKLQC